MIGAGPGAVIGGLGAFAIALLWIKLFLTSGACRASFRKMTKANQYSLLRQPQYLMYWATRISTTTAYQMLFVAVGWQVYDLTNSAFDLGLIGLLLSSRPCPGCSWSDISRITTTAAG